MVRGELDELLLPAIGKDVTERIVAVGHRDARLHLVLADGALEVIEVHAVFRVGGNLDDPYVRRNRAAKDAEERRTLHRDDIARRSHGTQTEADRFLGAGGDRDV